jgi:hypothetical protein
MFKQLNIFFTNIVVVVLLLASNAYASPQLTAESTPEGEDDVSESLEGVEPDNDSSGEDKLSDDETKGSPWVLTPTLSSDPKLGSSIGFLAGYVHYFDEDSPSSLFGVSGSYSDTDSKVGGIFAATYFDKDQQRLQAAYLSAKVENEYQDYLGTGATVLTTDEATLKFIRYLHRVSSSHWFLGAQAVDTDYNIVGKDRSSQAVLDLFGIDGFKGTALGLVVERDSRDSVNNPSSGSFFQVTNTEYLKSLNDDLEFGVWQAKYSSFNLVTDRHLLAMEFSGRYTIDAPKAAYSSVRLRGYTAGEYLAPHNMSIQVEDRIRLFGRWGATVFAGATCLFGDGDDCGESSSWFPMVGAGVTYLLKPSEGMVVRLEGARGQDDSYGVYLQFGNSF